LRHERYQRPQIDQPEPQVGGGAVLRRLREAIEQADAILFATPEYNSSIPGQLKNAIDWASRPFADTVLRNKPVAVIGASTGMFGAIWSQAELRKALAAAGARVVDRELAIAAAHEAFDERGALKDRELLLELSGILTDFIRWRGAGGGTTCQFVTQLLDLFGAHVRACPPSVRAGATIARRRGARGGVPVCPKHNGHRGPADQRPQAPLELGVAWHLAEQLLSRSAPS
jgi:chromate reductase, NAD(P)H dehydrogenase (quinone)